LLQQIPLRQLRRPRVVASLHGDALNAQAPLAKIDIRGSNLPMPFPIKLGRKWFGLEVKFYGFASGENVF